ncbi:GHKL domain-containing protein [Paenibacillus oenotherae]|uniref:histidine kinase n=1 Tax=Paenibacillus oenotherae TaxID=1435645 RepID=A0ABS7D3P3_9BACL|nr:GHKL domain-containing protein [Paenibacillus oenotherae]MBW7474550.1 GHKL domain-containing protein [Paenibacillus oenotherae]
MSRNVWLLTVILITVLLGVNNTIYYFTTKESLEDNLRHELESVAKQIQISIELSRNGAEVYQEQIGRELRAASIAAQFALNPELEKVTNAQLGELSDKLDLLDITLLQRTPDNIILAKSSDPGQIGLKTKTWDPWYKAFKQLFDERRVTIDWGQKLENFWSGPFEFSSSDTSKVNKWGYYYDGTTDYIIDPYISFDDRQLHYEERTGVSRLITRTLGENSSIVEIAVINPHTFPLGTRTTITEEGKELKHMTQEPIISGSNRFKHDSDKANVKLANEQDDYVWLDTHMDGKHIIKLYIPVSIDEKSASMVDENGDPINRYVLMLVADYKSIQDKLDKQFVGIILIIAIVTLLSLLVLYLAFIAYRKSRDKLVRKAQETYVDEVNGLFQSIRAQRHDFMNHVQTIHSFAQMNKTEELKRYTAELAGEIREMNDIINIGNPAIAALIRSKISQAEAMRIKLKADFTDLNKLELGVKSLDLTRMLGNLIDNAFDEVQSYAEERRCVSARGCQQEGYLEFVVSNICDDTAKLSDKRIFDPGYSTKNDAHNGLGLAIVKSIVDQYKGTVRIVMDKEDWIAFIIRIPH